MRTIDTAASHPPSVFHITHPKAGSQWVAQILRECAPDRIVEPQINMSHFFNQPLQPGGIYPALFLGRRQFEAVKSFNLLNPYHSVIFHHNLKKDNVPLLLNNWSNFFLKRYPFRLFIVVRDLRDMFISLYFSIKHSHPMITDNLIHYRSKLAGINQEEGLIFLMGEYDHLKNIQVRWLNKAGLYLRYEDLVAHEFRMFQKIVRYCELPVADDALKVIVKRNSFEARTGRRRGEEDAKSHVRKGVPGDWKNHYTPKVTEEFKRRFGKVLIQTGYEEDMDW